MMRVCEWTDGVRMKNTRLFSDRIRDSTNPGGVCYSKSPQGVACDWVKRVKYLVVTCMEAPLGD